MMNQNKKNPHESQDRRLTRRPSAKLSRLFRKPSLIDYDAVEKYIEIYGTPVCFCCRFITFIPVFRQYPNGWRVFCLNCGVTRDVIGTCLHDKDEDMSKRMINSEEMLNKLLDRLE